MAAEIKEDRVLVPVKLTDAMRERMGQIEDGPCRSYDDVWAEMLDAALIQSPLGREELFKRADAGELSWNEAQKRAAERS